MPPANGNKTYTVKQQHDALDIATFCIGVLTLVVLFIYTGINYYLYQATQAQLTQSQRAQRAYVTFGAKDGTLIQFDKEINGRRALKIFFVNAGQSVARHFVAQVFTNQQSPIFNHRHRAIDKYGGVMIAGPGDEIDLAPQGEHIEWITDPHILWTTNQISPRTNADGFTPLISITGEIQYCDTLGVYHCEPFGARYVPKLGEFIAWPLHEPSCKVEKMDPRMLHAWAKQGGLDYKEIEQCEQPDEPEYYRVAAPTPSIIKTPTPSATATR